MDNERASERADERGGNSFCMHARLGMENGNPPAFGHNEV